MSPAHEGLPGGRQRLAALSWGTRELDCHATLSRHPGHPGHLTVGLDCLSWKTSVDIDVESASKYRVTESLLHFRTLVDLVETDVFGCWSSNSLQDCAVDSETEELQYINEDIVIDCMMHHICRYLQEDREETQRVSLTVQAPRPPNTILFLENARTQFFPCPSRPSQRKNPQKEHQKTQTPTQRHRIPHKTENTENTKHKTHITHNTHNTQHTEIPQIIHNTHKHHGSPNS